MKKLLALTALAAMSTSMIAADANAWTRNRTISGPNGSATFSGSAGCASGTCTRQTTRTGPNGDTASRQRSVTCANGTCTGSVQGSGPYRGTYDRSGTVTFD